MAKIHNLKIENNAVAELSGVEEVLAFDDKSVSFALNEKKLILTGDKLTIESLDTVNGNAVVKGEIMCAKYVKKGIKAVGVLRKLFK